MLSLNPTSISRQNLQRKANPHPQCSARRCSSRSRSRSPRATTRPILKSSAPSSRLRFPTRTGSSRPSLPLPLRPCRCVLHFKRVILEMCLNMQRLASPPAILYRPTNTFELNTMMQLFECANDELQRLFTEIGMARIRILLMKIICLIFIFIISESRRSTIASNALRDDQQPTLKVCFLKNWVF